MAGELGRGGCARTTRRHVHVHAHAHVHVHVGDARARFDVMRALRPQALDLLVEMSHRRVALVPRRLKLALELRLRDRGQMRRDESRRGARHGATQGPPREV